MSEQPAETSETTDEPVAHEGAIVADTGTDDASSDGTSSNDDADAEDAEDE